MMVLWASLAFMVSNHPVWEVHNRGSQEVVVECRAWERLGWGYELNLRIAPGQTASKGWALGEAAGMLRYWTCALGTTPHPMGMPGPRLWFAEAWQDTQHFEVELSDGHYDFYAVTEAAHAQ